MAKIYKRSDRLSVKIGDLTIKLAPLSVDQKTELQIAFLNGKLNQDLQSMTKGLILSLKYSIKDIEGLVDSNDQPYKLKMDEQGNLSDESIEDLLNMEFSKQLSLVCAALVKGIPNEFTDENGKKIEGVEIVRKAESEKSEKN